MLPVVPVDEIAKVMKFRDGVDPPWVFLGLNTERQIKGAKGAKKIIFLRPCYLLLHNILVSLI